jgi:hypothetical protein
MMWHMLLCLLRRYLGLLLGLSGRFFGTICGSVDRVSIIEIVQLKSLIQESQIPVSPYPWLAVAEVVPSLDQTRALQVGDTVLGQLQDKLLGLL